MFPHRSHCWGCSRSRITVPPIFWVIGPAPQRPRPHATFGVRKSRCRVPSVARGAIRASLRLTVSSAPCARCAACVRGGRRGARSRETFVFLDQEPLPILALIGFPVERAVEHGAP